MTERFAIRIESAWPDGLEEAFEHFEVIDEGAWYRREVEAGNLILAMLVDRKIGDLCHILIRFEPVSTGLDFVAVGVVAVDPARLEVDVTEALVAACEPLALAQGCNAMRVHTRRPGLIDKLCRHDFEVVETVLRKRLGGDDGR